ncbi:MAG TPA: M56 family metallopeptidase [Gemmataceae bacterium]|nr:M56 family metallopeptidase [Gemmataceae bacterium]
MTHFIDTALEPALWFLADWSLRWMALIGLAALLLLIFRPRRSAVRQLVYLAALLGGLLLPLAPRWGNGWQTSPSEIASTPTSSTPQPQRENGTQPLPIVRASEPKDSTAKAPIAEPSRGMNGDVEVKDLPENEPWGRWRIVVVGLAVAWSAGVLLLLLRWGCGWWFLQRLRRGGVEMTEPVMDLFAACRAELGVGQNVRLAAHPLVRSPVLLGLFQPLILVPLDWPRLPVDMQCGGLLHELAHVRRRDHWLAPLLHLLRVSFFFHPFVRWLLARLEYERELLCDEMVIQRGMDRHDYARILLEFARASGRFALPGFSGASYLPMGQRRTIKTRINHLLEENMERWIRPLPTRWAIVLGTVLLGLMLGLASYRVLAVEPEKANAPAETEKPPVAKTNEEKAKEIKKEQAARIKREALRYGGKNFDQWRTELVTELKPSIRADGMKALAAFGANGYGAEATQAILEIMCGYDVAIVDSAEEDAPVVKASLAAISKIGASSVPPLIAAVKGENRNARRFAVRALAELGTDARSAMPALLQAMNSNDVETRCLAITAVVQIDPHTKGVVSALIKALQDQETAYTAMRAIKDVGEEAKAATAGLLAFLHDKDTQVQIEVIHALAAIGARKESAVAAGRMLRYKNQEARQQAYQFLQSLGADAKEAVPVLIAVLKDPEDCYRNSAVATLATIGPDAKEAIPELNKLLKANNTGMQSEIMSALKRINP